VSARFATSSASVSLDCSAPSDAAASRLLGQHVKGAGITVHTNPCERLPVRVAVARVALRQCVAPTPCASVTVCDHPTPCASVTVCDATKRTDTVTAGAVYIRSRQLSRHRLLTPPDGADHAQTGSLLRLEASADEAYPGSRILCRSLWLGLNRYLEIYLLIFLNIYLEIYVNMYSLTSFAPLFRNGFATASSLCAQAHMYLPILLPHLPISLSIHIQG